MPFLQGKNFLKRSQKINEPSHELRHMSVMRAYLPVAQPAPPSPSHLENLTQSTGV